MKSSQKINIPVLGVVAIIAIVILVLLFSAAVRTARVTGNGDKIYGGALKNVELPYLEGRTIGGGAKTTPEGVIIATEEEACQYGIPFRTCNRVADQITTIQTSCGEGRFGASVRVKQALEEQYPEFTCSEKVDSLGAYCCPVPFLRTRD